MSSAARGDDSKVRENDERIVDEMLKHTRPASDAAKRQKFIPAHARDWIRWLLDRDPEYAQQLIRYYEREAERRA